MKREQILLLTFFISAIIGLLLGRVLVSEEYVYVVAFLLSLFIWKLFKTGA